MSKLPLNTGLLLRRPYESSYAAFRRFLISNPLYRGRDIKQLLRRLDDHNINTTGKPPSLVELAQIHEREFIEFNGNELPAQPKLTTNVCTRNCQNCAEIGYHSLIYELTWLTCCPMHGTLLLPTCSRCGKAWPRISELFSRACSGCGARISVQKLVGRGAFTSSLAFESLKVFYGCLEFFKQLSCYALVPSASIMSRPFYTHPAISLQSKYFPTIYSHVDSVADSVFRKNSISIYPVSVFDFPLQDVSDHTWPLHHIDKMTPWIIRCRKGVLKQIIIAITRVLGTHHKARLVNIRSDAVRFAECPYCIALTIWFHYVNRKNISDRSTQGRFELDLYDAPAIHQMPHFPEPMRVLLIKDHEIIKKVELPLNLCELIYSIDLFTTYINILQYAVYYYTNLPNLRSESFLASFPVVANPEHSISHDIGFYSPDENTLHVVVPQDLIDKDKLPSFKPSEAYRFPFPSGFHFYQRSRCC